MATAPGRMEASSGMGPRKTMIIMVTVVGCVAILWPKVFYPMMVGNGQNKNLIKDHRGAGCCGVVLDQETFANASINYGGQQPYLQQQQLLQQQQQLQQDQQQQNLYRKRSFVPYVEIESIRQERPPHLRPEAMHPAMRERGRAIPHPGSIHSSERTQSPPRIVEGRPGPIPGMRPPMGAGSHQATKSANSMGFIMPLYTIGIVSFFIYTIMKLIFKKSPVTPYAEVKPDPVFRSEVFTADQAYIKRPDDGTTKLGQSAAEGEELVAPVANGAAAITDPQHPSVQAELTVDYEQLSKQKEASQPADVAFVELLPQHKSGLETANQELVLEAHAEDSGDEQLPPHDPTTEKVVDGFVVQMVASFPESSAGSAAGTQAMEAIESTLVVSSKESVDTKQNLPEADFVEEVIQKQYATIAQRSPVSEEPEANLEEAMEQVPEEQFINEAIQEQQNSNVIEEDAQNPTVSDIDEAIEEQHTSNVVETVEDVAQKPTESVTEPLSQEEQVSNLVDSVLEIAETPVEDITEEEAQVAKEVVEVEQVAQNPTESVTEDFTQEEQFSNVVEAAQGVEQTSTEAIMEDDTQMEQVTNEVVEVVEVAQLPAESVTGEAIQEEQVANVQDLAEPIIEEIIREQRLPTQSAVPVSIDLEEEVVKPVDDIVTATKTEEVTQEQKVRDETTESVTQVENDAEPAAVGPTDTMKEEIEEKFVPIAEEMSVQNVEVVPTANIEEQITVPENEVTTEPVLVQESTEQALLASEAKQPVEADTFGQDQEEPLQIIETVEVIKIVEVHTSTTVANECVEAPLLVDTISNEPTATIQAVKTTVETKSAEKGSGEAVSNETSESIECQIQEQVEQDAPIAKEAQETATEAVENISKETQNEKQTTSKDMQQRVDAANVDEPVKLEQPKITEETPSEQGFRGFTVLDAETCSMVCDAAEDIAITAEQLVQEVLEQAEELANLEQNQAPGLPTYDPATQKLVDGVIIERFEPVPSPPATSNEVVMKEVREEPEQKIEVIETVHAVQIVSTEDDGAEVDSISEDTSLSVASVIENQQPPAQDLMLNDTGDTFPEALITTEVMASSNTSSEPVFIEGGEDEDDLRPMVETETVLTVETLEEPDDSKSGNRPGAAVVETKGISIEEMHDDGAIVDQVEGKVIEEHIVPITIEGAQADTLRMTITEVTGDEGSTVVESPTPLSKTASNLPSPLVTVVPVMSAIDESAELAAEQPSRDGLVELPTRHTLEQVTKEALVERTLSEAAAVVNEIESIVDHIISEKLIQSGASEEGSGPARLAASAALVVEAVEASRASTGVHGMVPASESTAPGTPTLPADPATNGPPLTVPTNPLVVESSVSAATNIMLPASESLVLPAESSTTTSSSIEPSPTTTASPSYAPASAPATRSVPTHESVRPDQCSAIEQTHSINLAADAASASIASVNGTSGAPVAAVVGEQAVTKEQQTPLSTTETASGVTATSIGQVPTGSVSSTVTNPKFLTLNLANYSTSVNSSGNNSKSSPSSIANRAQALPGSISILAGSGDGTGGQLMELDLLRKKLDETERAMTKIIANMGSIPKGQESNVTADEAEPESKQPGNQDANATTEPSVTVTQNGHAVRPEAEVASGERAEKRSSDETTTSTGGTPEKKSKKRDTSTERGTMKVMAMEVTAQRENGKRLSRPTTPLLPLGHPEGASASADEHETRSIVLDGRLPHDSKILVAESETAVEKMEPEDSEEEDDAPVILSGKMTLSLINMDFIEKDATGTVAVGEIVTELHKPQEELTTAPAKSNE